MKPIPIVFSLMSSGFVLLFGLPAAIPGNADPSAAEQRASQMYRGQDGHMSNEMKGDCSMAGKTITGKVIRVENDNFVVKGQDGKEMLLHIDHTTQMGKNIVQGQSIQAKVTDQSQALLILSAEAVMDRRNDKE